MLEIGIGGGEVAILAGRLVHSDGSVLGVERLGIRCRRYRSGDGSSHLAQSLTRPARCDRYSYSTVQRMGRKSRLGPNQRARLWPVFRALRDALVAERFATWADVFTVLADSLARRSLKPFDHVIVDEAQDLAPAELRFFAALATPKADGLFLSGDVGQRIFQHPFSWASLGVDVRGHSIR